MLFPTSDPDHNFGSACETEYRRQNMIKTQGSAVFEILRKTAAGLFAVLIISSLAFSVSAAEVNSTAAGQYRPSSAITVYINDLPLTFDAEPELISGTTFVPVRPIFEALNIDFQWSDIRREVTADNGTERIHFKIGSPTAIHNSEITTLPCAPYLKNGRTMIPLRYLSEALGFHVEWDETQGRIDVKSTKLNQTADSEFEKDTVYSISSDEPVSSSFGNGYAMSVLGQNAILTYNEALQKGISSSTACKSARLSLKQAQQQIEEFYDMYSLNYNVTIMQARKELNLLSGWSERNVVVTEEQTAYSIKNDMDAVSLKLIERENRKDDLAYAQKCFQRDLLKFQAGSISQRELTESEGNVSAAEKQIKICETELESLYDNLSGSVSGDFGEYPALEFKQEYRPADEIDLSSWCEEAIETDPYLWYLKNSVDDADFKLQTYEYNVGGKSYELTQMDLTKARINYNGVKAKLKKEIYSRYRQLKQIEYNIEMRKEQKESLSANIDTMRTLYDAGVQSKQALEEILEKEREVSFQLLTLNNSHSQLRAILEKPYLAPTYMTVTQ